MKKYKPSKKQQSQIKGKFKPRYPKSKKEEQEFGSGKPDIMICKKCEAFYWYKSWHRSLEDYPKLKISAKSGSRMAGKNIKFTTCPACQMIKDKKYEGEIILEQVPEIHKKSIRTLIENFGKRAEEKDPMDRIISIKLTKVSRPSDKRKRGADSRKEFKGLEDMRILTTENQLAVRMAKKINEICESIIDCINKIFII